MPSENEEVYRIANKRLRLKDPELNLDVDEPFDPLLLPERPMWGQEVGSGSFVTGNVAGTEFYVETNGHPNGQCRLYYPSKTVKAEMYYSSGKLHGPSTFFSEKGQKLAHSWFVNGYQQGKVRWFYPDGSLYALFRYKDGLQHGKQEYFLPDGSHKTLLTYAMGIITDKCLAGSP